MDDTKASGNVGEWKAELDKSQTEKRKLDVELTRLREEQQAMHLNSTNQTKLDMKRKQKEAKEDAIQKVYVLSMSFLVLILIYCSYTVLTWIALSSIYFMSGIASSQFILHIRF